MEIDFFFRQLLNGLTLSVILILIALGLSVIYGLMRILNMAHGEFFILGAYVVVWTIQAGGDFWLGLGLAPLVLALFGFSLEKLFPKLLYTGPTATILATWGLGMIIRQSLKITMGARPLFVRTPFPGSVQIWGLEYPAYRIFIIGAGVVIIAAIVLLYLRTTFGLQIRAAIHDREMTAALGINTNRINTLSFMIGSGLAGLAGAMLSPLVPVGPLTGLTYLIKCFYVIIVGGAGSILGTTVGGFVIGGGESLLQFPFSPLTAEILILLIAVAIISVKPRGLIAPQ